MQHPIEIGIKLVFALCGIELGMKDPRRCGADDRVGMSKLCLHQPAAITKAIDH